jgi:fatty acid amide hydrolase 2
MSASRRRGGRQRLRPRLRRAGAILLATTNVPEGGLWMETDNRIRGRTNNPWDLRRTPGGSSGGEAALIATGASPFGVAADIGGSIRIPAAFCGIVGHKPTGRLVPTTGHWPAPAGDARGLLCLGPLGRRVEDLPLLLGLMAGPDGADRAVRPWPLAKPAAATEPRRLKVRFLEGRGMPPISADLRRVIDKAAMALERRGATVLPTPAKRFRFAALYWGARLMRDEGESYADILGDGSPVSVARELLRTATGRSRHTLPALVTVLSERLDGLLPGVLARFESEALALRRVMGDLLGDDTVLLHAPYSRVAPRHGGALLTPWHFAHTGLFNVLELPVTSLPCGFDARGLPLGLQIAAGPGQDRLSISVAAMLEEYLGGWVRAEPEG